MKNELKSFTNITFGSIRGIEINGESWLVGKDVAEVLGYANPSKAVLNHVDPEDKIMEMIAHSQNGNVVKTQTALINESGFYSLVLSSKLPGAKKFKRWVTSEVLPQIRQTGGYIPTKEEESDEEFLARALLVAQRTLEKKNKELEEMNKLVEKQKPKAEFYDEIIDSTTVIGMKEVADILKVKGYGRNNLFKFLREKGILNRKNEPYRKYIDQGLFEIKESKYIVENEVKIKPTTYVTQKGLDYIRKILNKQK